MYIIIALAREKAPEDDIELIPRSKQLSKNKDHNADLRQTGDTRLQRP